MYPLKTGIQVYANSCPVCLLHSLILSLRRRLYPAAVVIILINLVPLREGLECVVQPEKITGCGSLISSLRCILIISFKTIFNSSCPFGFIVRKGFFTLVTHALLIKFICLSLLILLHLWVFLLSLLMEVQLLSLQVLLVWSSLLIITFLYIGCRRKTNKCWIWSKDVALWCKDDSSPVVGVPDNTQHRSAAIYPPIYFDHDFEYYTN